MKTSTEFQGKHHLGQKLQRVREIKRMKQSALAIATGLSQQYISKLEQSADIPDEVLEKLAVAMGETAESIRNYEEKEAVNYQKEFSVNDNAVSIQNLQVLHYREQLEIVRALLEQVLAGDKEKMALLTRTNEELTEVIRKMKG